MTDIASLGIEVQTGDVTKAATELDKFVQAGEKAEKAAEGVGQSFEKASTAATGLASAETKLGESTEDAKTRLLAMAKASLDSSEYLKSLASSVNSSTSAMDAARATTTDFAALNRRLKADADALVGTVDQQAQSTRQAAAATGVQGDGLAKLLGQINPAAAALGRLDEQQRQLNQHRAAGNIDKDGFKAYSADIETARSKIKGFSDESVKAKGATDGFSLSAKGAQQNVLQLISALTSGNWSSGLHAIANLGITSDGISSLFSSGGAAALGDSLASIADKSKDVAESAGEAGESISDLAEKSNTAAESTKNARNALDALSSSTGVSRLGMLGIVAGVTAAVAAVGSLLYLYQKGQDESDEFNKSLILTGKSSGVTADQLGAMARQISAAVGTTGAASAALAQIAGNGKLAGDSFASIAESAISMKESTGKAVGETISEFVKLADDPVKASAALNEQYHYLTASVFSQISALEKQGDRAGAVKLATEQFADSIKDRTPGILENLSFWERGYNAVAKAADSLKNIGRGDIDLDIENTEKSLARAQKGDVGAFQNRKVMVNYYLEKLDMLRGEKTAKEEIAKLDEDNAKAEIAGQKAILSFDARKLSIRSNKEKRQDDFKVLGKEIAALRISDPSNERLSPESISEQKAAINARYKDPKVSSPGAVDLTEFNASQNAIKSILADYSNAQKELDALQKAGLVSQEEYGWKRAGLIGNEKDEITAAYEAEIAALESAKIRKTTSAAQAIELDKKIADARTDMIKAQQDADSKLKVLEIDQEGRLKKQTLAINSYIDALTRQNQALQQAGQHAAAGVGLGDRQNTLNGELNGIEDRANQQRLDLARDKADAARNMSADEYNQKLVAINKSESDLKETTLSNYEEMSAAQSDWRNGATAAFQNYLDSARNVAGQTKSLFSNAFSSMEDAVVNFAITGKGSFADFTQSILADMARIAARQASSALLSSLVGAAAGYFGGGSSPQSAGSTPGGYSPEVIDGWSGVQQAKGGAWDSGVQMFANGGAFTNTIVSKPTAFGMANGKTGVMGEAGEEAIMPLTRTANGKLGVMAVGGGGGGTSLSFNMPIMVMTDEESGRPEGAELDTEAFQRNMQERMRAVAKEEIAKSWRQGGVSSRNVKG
ncbi:phage tail tape measure protein [Pseudomonas helleri]|uniref:phage tail tape measure protein n=1 Tax=Pseudomonas helleri TaxID=1608996 RepID=UPI0030D85914